MQKNHSTVNFAAMFSHFSTVIRSCLFLIRSRAICLRFRSHCHWYMSVHKNRPHSFTCSVLCDPIEIKWVHTYVWSYVVAVTLWRVRVCVDSRQWMEIVLACYIHILREYTHMLGMHQGYRISRGSFFSFLFLPTLGSVPLVQSEWWTSRRIFRDIRTRTADMYTGIKIAAYADVPGAHRVLLSTGENVASSE